MPIFQCKVANADDDDESTEISAASPDDAAFKFAEQDDEMRDIAATDGDCESEVSVTDADGAESKFIIRADRKIEFRFVRRID
jgi:hypothetical protein